MEIADVRDARGCRRSSAARTSSSTSPGRRRTSTRCTTRTPTSRSTAARSSRSSRPCGTRTPRRRSSSRRRGSSTGGRSICPVDERHPLAPVDPNGVNKAAGEGYHLVYGEVYGLRCSVLRLTNTYGPRMRVKDDRQTFLGTWLRLAVEGEELLVFGDGKQQRDFTYVDDAVEAFLLRGRRRTRRRRDVQRRRRAAGGAGRSRRAAGRGRRGGLVAARAVPGGAALDRHRRLLRRRLEDPGGGSAGSRASGCARGSSGRSRTTASTRAAYW